jgi:hypothetical protein
MRRAGRQHERGAQSLEWVGLGSFILSALVAATAYAHQHLGDELGQLLIGHLKSFVSQ